jgi:hypothetical protein
MNTIIEFTDNTKAPVYLKDDEYNYQTSIPMCGRDVLNYGATIWTNLVNIMEHFANDVPPINATEGQLWYDTKNDKVMLNIGQNIGNEKWIPLIPAPIIPEHLLLRTGGHLNQDLRISGDIHDDSQIVHKKYVDENYNAIFNGMDDGYQYNIMEDTGLITLNGVIFKKDINGGAYIVKLPKVMKDLNYTVVISSTTVNKSYIPTSSPSGHGYSVKDKMLNNFTIMVDEGLPIGSELNFIMIGYCN